MTTKTLHTYGDGQEKPAGTWDYYGQQFCSPARISGGWQTTSVLIKTWRQASRGKTSIFPGRGQQQFGRIKIPFDRRDRAIEILGEVCDRLNRGTEVRSIKEIQQLINEG